MSNPDTSAARERAIRDVDLADEWRAAVAGLAANEEGWYHWAVVRDLLAMLDAGRAVTEEAEDRELAAAKALVGLRETIAVLRSKLAEHWCWFYREGHWVCAECGSGNGETKSTIEHEPTCLLSAALDDTQ